MLNYQTVGWCEINAREIFKQRDWRSEGKDVKALGGKISKNLTLKEMSEMEVRSLKLNKPLQKFMGISI